MLRNFLPINNAAEGGKFVLSLDGKHSLLMGKFKLVTVFALYRSQLGRCDKNKMDFRVTHYAPLMQCICPEESTAATEFLFRTLVDTIREEFQVDLTNRVAAVTMDHSLGFNSARAAVFPGSQRVLDYYHVVERQKETMHSGPNGKLRNAKPPRATGEKDETKKFVEKSATWVAMFIEKTRPIWNICLFHIAWKYTLEKIEFLWGAKECVEYLFKERLTIRPPDVYGGKQPRDVFSKKLMDILTCVVNGKEYCGVIGSQWRSSLSAAPPMAASGTSGGESYQRPLRQQFGKERSPAKVLYDLEHRIYPQTVDCASLRPKAASFPQDWNDCLLTQSQSVHKRQMAANLSKKAHASQTKLLPSADEYVEAYRAQERTNAPRNKRSIRIVEHTVNSFTATVYVMHRCPNSRSILQLLGKG